MKDKEKDGEKNKNLYRDKRFWIFCSITFFVFVQILFRTPAPCKWLEAVWGAGDLITFIGTIVLGYVAISQTAKYNDMVEQSNKISEESTKIAKQSNQLAENVFIADNSTLAFLESAKIESDSNIACNFNLHYEQIVSSIDDVNKDTYYRTYNIEFIVKITNNVAAVNVHKILIIANWRDASNQSNEVRQHVNEYVNNENEYSRVAIVENGIAFSVLVIDEPEKRDILINNMCKHGFNIHIDITYTLLSDKYVSSKLMSRVKFNYKNGLKDSYKFCLTDKQKQEQEPMCYWYGNKIEDRNTLVIKGDDVKNNGQDENGVS